MGLSAVLKFITLALFSAAVGATSRSTCSSVSVLGVAGSMSGVYTDRGVTRGGRPTFRMDAGDDEAYVLLFVDLAPRGRLRAANLGGQVALSSPIHRSISETLGKAVDMYGSEAEPVEWNRASCAEGSWVIVKEVGDAALTYPRYLAGDCASHPSGISAAWLEDACETCSPRAVSVSLSCVDVIERESEVATKDSGSSRSSSPVSRGAASMATMPGRGSSKEGTSSSTSDCSVITVIGGGVPGEYPYIGVDGRGYDVWGTDERAIAFLPSSRTEDGLQMLGDPADTALQFALQRANRRLMGCKDGSAWVMVQGRAEIESPTTYPRFQAPDCAEGVLDVSSPWYEIASNGAEPSVASPQPVIVCTEGNGMTSATADRSASVTTMTSLRASFASLNGAGEGFGASPPAFGDGHPVEAEILESAAPLPRWGKTMTFVARMSISALAVVGSTAMAFAT